MNDTKSYIAGWACLTNSTIWIVGQPEAWAWVAWVALAVVIFTIDLVWSS
jgi:hypothetical protein